MDRYNKILSDVMEHKSVNMDEWISIEKNLYFTEEDKDEILNWDYDESKVIWEKIKSSVLKENASGLNYYLCPFCYKHGYDHQNTHKKLGNPVCQQCGYGKRHGYCSICSDNSSDFRKILNTFDKDRVQIHTCLSNNYYKNLIYNLEGKHLK